MTTISSPGLASPGFSGRESRALLEARELLSSGRWHAALDAYSRSITDAVASDSGQAASPEFLQACEEMANLALLVFRQDTAQSLLTAVVQLWSRQGRPAEAWFTALKLAWVLVESGRFDEAHRVFEQLEPCLGPLAEVPSDAHDVLAWELHWLAPDASAPLRAPLAARAYLVLGRYLAAQGFYSQAELLLVRGLEYTEPSSPLAHSMRVHLLLALSAVRLERGALVEARRTLAEIEPVSRDVSRPAEAVRWLETSARLDWMTGQMGRALRAFQHITNTCWEHGLLGAALVAMLNQAEVLIVLNQLPLVEEILAEVAETLRARSSSDAHLPPDMKQEIAQRRDWLEQLAMLRRQSALAGVELATSVFAQVRRKESVSKTTPVPFTSNDPIGLPQNVNFLAFYETRELAVKWALARGDHKLAGRRLDKLHEIFGACDSRLIAVRLEALDGLVTMGRRDLEAAAQKLRAARDGLDAMNLKSEAWQAERYLALCGELLNWPEAQWKPLAVDAEQRLEELASSLPADERSDYLANKWTVAERGLQVAIDELVALRSEVERSPWHRRLGAWRCMATALSDLLDRLDDHRRDLIDNSLEEMTSPTSGRIGWWQRWWKHPWQRATIVTLLLPDRLFVVRVSWLSCTFTVVPVTRVALRHAVQAIHTAVASLFDARDPSAAAASLPKLTERLHASLDAIAGKMRLDQWLDTIGSQVCGLTIVADDALHGLPWNALRYRGRYLIEHWSISMALVSRSAPKRPKLRLRESGLAMIQVEGSPDQTSGVEFRRVTGEAATVGSALAICRTAGVVHFLCHGIFQPDRRPETGLLLWPRTIPDGLLSIESLGREHFKNLQHATLVACWGADNFVRPGRRIVSLPQVLQRAGAESVLGCFWPVELSAGSRLASRFYEHARRLPRDKALRQAVLDVITDKNRASDTASPVFWAGFQLHGDPGRLRW